VQFSNDNSIPLYCFAESYATHGKRQNQYSSSFVDSSPLLRMVFTDSPNSFVFYLLGAYHIFSCGNEIYTNPASIIGNAQEPQADVDCSKFFEKQKIEVRLLASNP